jgi:hypothetical protein
VPVSFAKIAGDIHRNRKVRKAGPDAREVFFWVLCQNALHDRSGWVPKADVMDFEHVAEELQRNASVTRNGVSLCIEHGLLREEGDRVVIVGWDDEWGRRPLTNAERQAKYRESQRDAPLRVTGSNDSVTRNESNVGEEKPSRKRPATPAPDTWTPNDKHRELAAALGLSCDVLASEFLDWHRSKGNVFADWDAAFRTWMRNATKFAQQSRLPAAPSAAQPSVYRPIPKKYP